MSSDQVLRGYIKTWLVRQRIYRLHDQFKFYNFIFNSFKNKFIADKEQRVYENKYRNTLYLRSTLMNFERNYQFKIPSKLINKSRFFTSKATQQSDIYTRLNPYFVTGFSYAESFL